MRAVSFEAFLSLGGFRLWVPFVDARTAGKVDKSCEFLQWARYAFLRFLRYAGVSHETPSRIDLAGGALAVGMRHRSLDTSGPIDAAADTAGGRRVAAAA